MTWIRSTAFTLRKQSHSEGPTSRWLPASDLDIAPSGIEVTSTKYEEEPIGQILGVSKGGSGHTSSPKDLLFQELKLDPNLIVSIDKLHNVIR